MIKQQLKQSLNLTAELLSKLKSIPKDLASATEDSNPFEIINSQVTMNASTTALNIIFPYFRKFEGYQLEVKRSCLYKMEGDRSLAVVPVIDKKAIYLAVSKNAFPKYKFQSSDDEWHFLTLRTPTGAVLYDEVTNEFKKMFENQTFYRFLAKRKVTKEGEGEPFPHFDSSVAGLLRPKVTKAVAASIRESDHIPMTGKIDDTTHDLPSFLRYPYLISGESGSGKTVASLQLADKLEMRAQEYWKDKRPNDPMPAVLAIYKDTPLASSKNVLEGVAEAIASEVKSVWESKQEEESHIEKSLANVLIYVVLDEMGAYKDAVRELVREYTVFNTKLSKALTKEGWRHIIDPHLNRILIVLSIVGTGVGYPDSHGSIGSPYNTAKAETDPYALITEPFKSSLEKDRLLKVLMTNFRCAAYLADRLPTFFSFCKDLSPVSQQLASMVTADYIQSDGWKSKFQVGGDGEKYLSLLVSLKFTQEYRCHALTDAELSTLCTSLGAVVDLLEWRAKTGPEDTTDDAKYADLMKCDHLGFNPIVTKPATSVSTHEVTPHLKSYEGLNLPPGTRYYFPPAIALMALVYQSMLEGRISIFSSDSHSPSFTYEKFTSLTLRMILSAFQNAGIKSFPPNFLFRNASAELKDAFINKPLVAQTNLTGPFVRPMKPVTIKWPPDSLASTVQRFNVPFVEEAADGAPQNDNIINGVGLTIGVENKFFPNGSVSALVLLKRAYQMGYGNVEFVIPYEIRKHYASYDKYDVSEQIYCMLKDVPDSLLHVHDMSVGEKTLTFQLKTDAHKNVTNNLAFTRSLVLDYDRRRTFKTGHADVLVMTSSSKSIIPEGVRITFMGKYELEDESGENLSKEIAKPTFRIDLSMKISKDVSARVVGWHYSLEEYLRASEDKEKVDVSTNSNRPQLTAFLTNYDYIQLSRFVAPRTYYIKVNGTKVSNGK